MLSDGGYAFTKDDAFAGRIYTIELPNEQFESDSPIRPGLIGDGALVSAVNSFCCRIAHWTSDAALRAGEVNDNLMPVDIDAVGSQTHTYVRGKQAADQVHRTRGG
jgi:hypothetical protein